MKYIKRIMGAFLTLVVTTMPVMGDYLLRYSVFDNGGEKTSSSDFILKDAIGQSVIGKSTSSEYLEYTGFFHPEKVLVGIEEPQRGTNLPQVFSLSPLHPNPMSRFTCVEYGIPEKSQVSITIYDLTGREVDKLCSSTQEPGFYRKVWDGSLLPSGVYFLRVDAGSFTATRKLLLLR